MKKIPALPNYNTLRIKYFNQAYTKDGKYTQIILTPEQTLALLRSWRYTVSYKEDFLLTRFVSEVLNKPPFCTALVKQNLKSCKVLKYCVLCQVSRIPWNIFEFRFNTVNLLNDALAKRYPNEPKLMDVYFISDETNPILLLGRIPDKVIRLDKTGNCVNLLHPTIIPCDKSDELFREALINEYPHPNNKTVRMLIIFREEKVCHITA